MKELTMEEKAKRYDDLQKWYWWLERRADYLPKNNIPLMTYLDGISNHLDTFTEENE